MKRPRLAPRGRKRAIAAIREARFSVGAFDDMRRENAAYWASPRNDMARGIYAEAMREKQRLAKLPVAQLLAEAAAMIATTAFGENRTFRLPVAAKRRLEHGRVIAYVRHRTYRQSRHAHHETPGVQRR